MNHLFYPIFNFKQGNPLKMFCIVRHHHTMISQSNSSYKQVYLVNTLSFQLQESFCLTIIIYGCIYRKDLEGPLYIFQITKMLGIFGFPCSIRQLGESHL